MSLSGSLRSIIPTPRDNPEFVELDLRHYTCPVCNNVLKDCVQLPCGHKVCETCVDTLFTDSSLDGQCPINDEDCFLFQRIQVSMIKKEYKLILFRLYSMANLDQTLLEYFLGCLLSELYPTTPSANQDSRYQPTLFNNLLLWNCLDNFDQALSDCSYLVFSQNCIRLPNLIKIQIRISLYIWIGTTFENSVGEDSKAVRRFELISVKNDLIG